MDRPSQAVILVGGRGRRLGPLTETCPKPLIEVAGRPFLDHLLDRVTAAGLGRIVLLAGHRGDRIVDRYDGTRRAGAEIGVVVEPAPLGTAGALRFAADRLETTFLMLNGDSLFDCGLAEFVAERPDGDWLGWLALRHLPDTGRAGVVDLDGARITAFRERGAPGVAGLSNAGIYLLRRDILTRVPQGPASLEREVFPALAAAGRLRGQCREGYFIDIGVPEDLTRARRDLGEGGG